MKKLLLSILVLGGVSTQLPVKSMDIVSQLLAKPIVDFASMAAIGTSFFHGCYDAPRRPYGLMAVPFYAVAGLAFTKYALGKEPMSPWASIGLSLAAYSFPLLVKYFKGSKETGVKTEPKSPAVVKPEPKKDKPLDTKKTPEPTVASLSPKVNNIPAIPKKIQIKTKSDQDIHDKVVIDAETSIVLDKNNIPASPSAPLSLKIKTEPVQNTIAKVVSYAETIDSIETVDAWVKFFGRDVASALEKAIKNTPAQKEEILAASAKTLNRIIGKILNPSDIPFEIPKDLSITPKITQGKLMEVLDAFKNSLKSKYESTLSLFSLNISIDSFKEKEKFTGHIIESRLCKLLTENKDSDIYKTTVNSLKSMRDYGKAFVEKLSPMLQKEIDLKGGARDLSLKIYETTLFLDKMSNQISTDFHKASEKIRGRLDELIIKEARDLLCKEPQGIGNTEGTCFLNTDLQLLMMTYCIPEVYQEMQYDISLPAQNPHFERNLSLRFKEFMNAYAKSMSSGALEKLLQSIEQELYKIDPRLDLRVGRKTPESIVFGRTHRVMEIMAGSLTQHPSIIDCSKGYFADFASDIGFITNSLSLKDKFDKDVEERKLKARGIALDAGPTIDHVVSFVENAQRERAYVAIEIARAVGVNVVLGISAQEFRWPKILIVSTTREVVKGTYKTLGAYASDAQRNALKTIVKREDLIKFQTTLDLSKYGFQKNQESNKPAPTYNLIALSGRWPGHAMAVVKRGDTWWTCSNDGVKNATETMKTAAQKGLVAYSDFGETQDAIPEILVYEKAE